MVENPRTRQAHVSALRLSGLNKSFDGHQALTDAQFDVHWGELHALLGENGAGKSTLMNTVCGLYTSDSGEIRVNNELVSIAEPRDATRLRIGMVHQHYKLVNRFSIAENVLIACATTLGHRSISQVKPLIDQTAESLGFSVDPDVLTSELSIAERQRVEIIKLIMLGADILVLDEPTAVLTDSEAHNVLTLLRSMAGQGKAVILITHRLKEVTHFADRVTIMRGGRTILAGAEVTKLSESGMAEAMVGQSMQNHSNRSAPYPSVGHIDGVINGKVKKPRLELRCLSVHRPDGRLAIDDLSVIVSTGEILGIAGVGGNGQTELAEALFGLHPISSGEARLDGEDMAELSIADRRKRGLRLVPADRFAYALFADMRAFENLGVTDVPTGRYGNLWWLSRRKMKQHAARKFMERDITGGTPNTRSRLLSGGNAQKLLLARELSDGATMLVAHSPTRGLDVRAHQVVHDTILDCVKTGAACLLISEDLDEVLALSTRVGVLSRGQLFGPYPTKGSEAVDRTRIGELMAGHA